MSLAPQELHQSICLSALNGAKGVELNVTELEHLPWPGYEIA
jgi:hypothetical protein